MRRMFQWFLVVVTLCLPASAVGDDLEDFVIAGDDFADFSPSRFDGVTALWGPLVFVVGSVPTLDPFSPDAAIVAMHKRRATEVWRAFAGAPGRGDSFHHVAASAGRVCAVGEGSEFGVGSWFVLVACYRALTGELLWEREFPMQGLARAVDPYSIQLSGSALVVTIFHPLLNRLVLLFNARDGS